MMVLIDSIQGTNKDGAWELCLEKNQYGSYYLSCETIPPQESDFAWYVGDTEEEAFEWYTREKLRLTR
jgi:hypothetical protein